MRLVVLFTAAALVAGCEPTAPEPPASPPAADRAAARPGVAAPIPDIAWDPKSTELPVSDQTRGQTDASIRELDHRAATLGSDIAGARQQADAAFRAAAPAEPAPGETPPNAARPGPTPPAQASTSDPTPPARAEAPVEPTPPARAAVSPPPPTPPGA